MPKKVDKVKILDLYDSGGGLSIRAIHDALGYSRNTIKTVIAQAADAGVLDRHRTLTPEELAGALNKAQNPSHQAPIDFDYMKTELELDGVNRKLLWTEYCLKCADEGTVPYQYSQFCKLYSEWAQTKAVTRRIPRKPGYCLEVDWVGDKARIYDRITGEEIAVWLFCATMAYSSRMYAEAFLDMKLPSWIAANVHALRFFGGVPTIIVPDNLKTGVRTPDYFEPVIGSAYADMARHYDTTIVPAQVAKPKQKPNVEKTVDIVETWVIAALRHHRFYSLSELNDAIYERIQDINAKVMAAKGASRDDLFFNEEDRALKPLPQTDYKLSIWKKAKLAQDVHFQYEKMRYSAPCEYVGKELDLRITDDIVEAYCSGRHLCTHKRLYGRIGQYSTKEEHMPTHMQDGDNTWSRDGFVRWASKVGPNCKAAVMAILDHKVIVQQAYRSCRGILQLAKKKGEEAVEEACKTALAAAQVPSYTQIRNLVTAKESKPAVRAGLDDLCEGRIGNGGFLRDPATYGRGGGE
jgi:transposase